MNFAVRKVIITTVRFKFFSSFSYTFKTVLLEKTNFCKLLFVTHKVPVEVPE